MKTNLQVKRFDEFCKIIKGKTPTLYSEKKVEYLPYLSAKFMRGTNEAEYALKSDLKSITVNRNQIIIICDGSNSGECFIGWEGILASTMAKIEHSDEIDTRFLKMFLEITFEEFNKKKTGAAIPHLDLKFLKNLEIPVPEISEQRRIVEVLDKALGNVDDSIKKTQQNIANLKELWNSALNQAFTHNSQHWQEKKLSEVCVTILAGGDKPSVFSKIKTNKCNIPIYANAVALNGLYGFTDKALVVQDSVTVAARGSKVGFVCIRNEKYLPIVRLIVAIPDKEILENEYLGYALKYIIPQGNGTAIPQITIPNFKRNKILLPPLSEQKQIVEKLDALSAEIKAIESNYFKELENLSELKQAILNKAFNGEL